MAGSVNKVILIGNLGQDPEVRSFQNGGKIANLRIATSETWKDRNSGERRERTEWHTVAVYSEPLVRVVEQYLKKGSKILSRKSLGTPGPESSMTTSTLPSLQRVLTRSSRSRQPLLFIASMALSTSALNIARSRLG